LQGRKNIMISNKKYCPANKVLDSKKRKEC
jgi:hypothetical protein